MASSANGATPADNGAAALPAPPYVHPFLVTLAITVGSIMGALDMSIVNVALPYIQGNLGVTINEVAWVSTGYIISLVIIMPLTSWLSFRFGRKRIYMICLAVFTAASFCCGIAHTFVALIACRCLQGMGAGAMQPVQQAILRETFPADKQGMAMGIFGVVVMIGPAVGPTLGGYITDNYNWPWIFFINVPLGFLALWMVARWIHDPPYLRSSNQSMSVDGLGILLLTVGLASLQTVLDEGETYDWYNSNLIAGLTILATVILVAFVWWELRAKAPAVDFSVLKSVSFTTGTVIGGLLGVSLFASMFLLPLFMQELLQYDATESGLALMPRALAMVVFMPVAGALYNRLGPRIMVGFGLLGAGMSTLMMGRFTLDTGYFDFMWPQVGQGIGFDFIFVALSTAALSGISKAHMTSAAGLYNLVRQLGGSFGTAIFATLVEQGQQLNRAVLIHNLSPFSTALTYRLQMLQQTFMGMGLDYQAARLKALALLDGDVNLQASIASFEHAFILIGVLFFVCLPLVGMLKNVPATGSHSDVLEA